LKIVKTFVRATRSACHAEHQRDERVAKHAVLRPFVRPKESKGAHPNQH